MRTLVLGITGGLLVAVGLVLLVLPGPGWLLIIAGLALLARRFDWAHGLLTRTRDRLPPRIAQSRPATLALPPDDRVTSGHDDPGADDAHHDDEDPAVPAA